MASAEGEIQEKGYVASFPVLINVEGEATYIMVLKDAGGQVRRYALVNVEQYSVVATAATQTEAMSKYKALLFENGIIDDPGNDPVIDPSDTEEITLLVDKITLVAHGGESYIYFTGLSSKNEKIILRKAVQDDPTLLFAEENDTIKFKAKATENASIFEIASWEKIPASVETPQA